MGAVTGNPVDGGAAPGSPLDTTSLTPQVYLFDLDGSGNQAQATVTFSGLAPGIRHLYQINFVVPTGLVSSSNASIEIDSGVDSDTPWRAILPITSTTSAARTGNHATPRPIACSATHGGRLPHTHLGAPRQN